MSCPSQRTVAQPPCLPLDIKDSLKEDEGVFLAEGKFMEGGLLKGFFLLKGELLKRVL
jgi:hypothetical protein